MTLKFFWEALLLGQGTSRTQMPLAFEILMHMQSGIFWGGMSWPSTLS